MQETITSDSMEINLKTSDGEQLIRQILRFKLAAKREGRKEPGMIWSQNWSGLPASLPQILKKSGIEAILVNCPIYFPNNPNPVNSLLWQGIDGTKIPIYFLKDLSVNSQISTEALEIRVRTETDSSTGIMPIWVGDLPRLSDDVQVSELLTNRKCSLLQREYEFYNALSLDRQEERSKDNSVAAPTVQSRSEAEWNELLNSTLQSFAASVNTRGVKRPVLVMNSHSCFANEAVRIPLKADEYPVAALGSEGELQPVQIISADDGARFALFVAKNVPMHGYSVWDLMATSVAPEFDDPVFASSTSLENELLRVEFDYTTGLITSIFDKNLEREALNPAIDVSENGKRSIILENTANRFQLSDDHQSIKRTILDLESSEVVESGPVRGALRFTRKFGGSRIVQTVRLTSGSARLDFFTEIEWHESEQILEVTFPVAINALRASIDIPFGCSELPTFYNPGFETFTIEPIADSWVDLSEGDYGVALLNDSSFSSRVDRHTIRLSLLNLNAGSPNKIHQFNYSLLPHDGDLREGEIVENTCSLRSPPRALAITGNQTGILPLEQSYFELDNAGAFIESIHPSLRCEPGETAIIVRLYEGHNTRGTVAITSKLAFKRAFLTDLLERELVEIPIADGGILLPILPFEIITVKFILYEAATKLWK